MKHGTPPQKPTEPHISKRTNLRKRDISIQATGEVVIGDYTYRLEKFVCNVHDTFSGNRIAPRFSDNHSARSAANEERTPLHRLLQAAYIPRADWLGGKFTVKNDKEWVLEYDGYNVRLTCLPST
ncbi:MAG: hypothetical protein RR975_14565 [Clostridia bacterium]